MFSVELVRLYLAIGSEIDVVLKELCKKINPKSKASKINEYKETITPEIEGFINQSAISFDYDIHFKPWSAWSGENNPDWWKLTTR